MNRTKFISTCQHAVTALLILTLFLAWAVGPRAASAHAEVQTSTPAAGATVHSGLTEITIVFDDELDVDGSTAQVKGPDGATLSGVTAAVNRAERNTMTIKTPPLAEGTYSVQWKAVSMDDNNIANGTLTFTVAPSTEAATPVPGSPQSQSEEKGTAAQGQGTGSLPQTGSADGLSLYGSLALCAILLVAGGYWVRRRANA